MRRGLIKQMYRIKLFKDNGLFFAKLITFINIVSLLLLKPLPKINSFIPSMIKNPLKIGVIFIVFSLFFLLFAIEKKIRNNSFLFIFLIYAIYNVAVTYFNKGYIINSIYEILIIDTALIMLTSINYSFDFNKFIKQVYYIAFFSLFIIFIYSFVFYFFSIKLVGYGPIGQYNKNFCHYFLFIFIFGLYCLSTNHFNKIDIIISVISFIFIIFDLFIYNMKTIRIIIVLMVLLIILFKHSDKCINIVEYLFNPFLVALYNVLFFLFFVVLRHDFALKYFDGFSGRYVLWEMFFDRANNIMVGFGQRTMAEMENIINMLNFGEKLSTWHNAYLDIIFEGGLIGLLIFLLLIVLICFNIYNIKNKLFKVYLSICFFFFLFRFQFESVDKTTFLFILSLMFYISLKYKEINRDEYNIYTN